MACKLMSAVVAWVRKELEPRTGSEAAPLGWLRVLFPSWEHFANQRSGVIWSSA